MTGAVLWLSLNSYQLEEELGIREDCEWVMSILNAGEKPLIKRCFFNGAPAVRPSEWLPVAPALPPSPAPSAADLHERRRSPRVRLPLPPVPQGGAGPRRHLHGHPRPHGQGGAPVHSRLSPETDDAPVERRVAPCAFARRSQHSLLRALADRRRRGDADGEDHVRRHHL